MLVDATRGLLLPNAADGRGVGQLGYTVQAKDGLASGTLVKARAVVRFNAIAPQETQELVQTLDTGAPLTTLTANAVQAGGSDYEVRWTAVHEEGGAGVAHVTVDVAKDGGDFRIWKRQTSDSFDIYSGEAGHRYEFLALATDLAGNREAAPGGVQAPDDGSGANLAACRASARLRRICRRPWRQRRRRPIPCSSPHSSRFRRRRRWPSCPSSPRSVPVHRAVLRHRFRREPRGDGPLAIVEMPDGSTIISGGPNRGWLYRIAHDGGRALQPFVELDEPIFDLALDEQGQLWATTGGGALLRLNADSGEILARFGTGITQALAIKPFTGEILRVVGRRDRDFRPEQRQLPAFQRPAR